MQLFFGQYEVVTKDPKNVDLIRHGVSKEGNPTETLIGHYGSVQNALKKLIDNKLVTDNATDINQLLDTVERCKAEITAVLSMMSIGQ